MHGFSSELHMWASRSSIQSWVSQAWHAFVARPSLAAEPTAAEQVLVGDELLLVVWTQPAISSGDCWCCTPKVGAARLQSLWRLTPAGPGHAHTTEVCLLSD